MREVEDAIKVAPEVVPFLVEQCERVLEGSLTDRRSIQQRANMLLGGMAAAMTFIGQSTFEHGDVLPAMYRSCAIIWLGLMGLMAAPLIWLNRPGKYADGGVHPANLVPDYIEAPLDDVQLRYAADLEWRIAFNQRRNRWAAWTITIVMLAVFILPFGAIGIVWYRS